MLIGALCAAAGAAALESGAPIPVGAKDGRGPLAADAIVSDPLGAAHVTGHDMPDLFVATGRFGLGKGLFVYPAQGRDAHGVPIFGAPMAVGHPFDGEYPPPGTVFERGGRVHGVWRQGPWLVHTLYDDEQHAFKQVGRVKIEGLPRGARHCVVVEREDGKVDVVLEVGDGTTYKPTDYEWRDARYQPYDGAGMWRGGHPYAALWAITLPKFFESPASDARRVSATEREVRWGYMHLTRLDLGETSGVLGGSRYGGLHFYPRQGQGALVLAPKRHLVDRKGVAHRHPNINPGPIAYPNAKGLWADVMAGGEGCVSFYRFTGEFTDADKPVYDAPAPVLEQPADLYAGSLPVPNVVDWDGDGAMDLVAGNSEGRVLFFRNAGTNAAPAYLNGVPIEAGGRPIHVQPGYRLDIQGPAEARWGYTCPTVADWNEDGLPDLLMSDSTARHHVYLNRGTRTAPKLDPAHPIYYDGLDLYGTWRVQPAVAKLGGRMAYVALDADDMFHLYWKVDDYNVEDGGKLELNYGAGIHANYLSAGGTGRLKLSFADWDRDGLQDLLVGTPRHASVPDLILGLPKSLGIPGAAVLFLKNVGKPGQPVFAFPKVMAFRGKNIYLGAHACGPAAADFGGEDGPDLIVGEEGGRLIYYNREDLSPTE